MKSHSLPIFFFIIFAILVMGCTTDNYDEGLKSYNKGSFDTALIFLNKVELDDQYYKLAQGKIKEIEDTLLEIRKEKAAQDSIERQARIHRDSVRREEIAAKRLEDFKVELTNGIENVKKYDQDIFISNMNDVRDELLIFESWAKLIKRAKIYEDKEILSLGKILETRVVALQRSVFPKIRKSYGDFTRRELWEENIEVQAKGTRYSTLEFEGGYFANNRNIKETYQTLREVLELLRFKRVNFKWFKYDDEYSYYTISSKDDGELVDF